MTPPISSPALPGLAARFFRPVAIAFLALAAQSASGQSEALRGAFRPPPEFAEDYGDFRSVLAFEDGREVGTPEQWQERRAEILAEWTGLLGEWPPLITEPRVEILETVREEGYTREKIRFEWIPGEQTEGYLLLPDGAEPGATPAVLTVFYEPETAVGIGGKPNRDFALQLVREGFVALSIGTTEATAARTFALYWPSIDRVEVQPLSMLACAAANAWHVLADRPEVDPARIGVTGHSFGGKWAMFAGCLFDKFAAVAVSDPGIVLGDTLGTNYWEPWYLGWHPRPWRKRGLITEENPARGLYLRLLAEGRDLHELHALLAPRPFLVSGGKEDQPSQWRALNHLVRVNKILGQENRVAMTNRPAHDPTPGSNAVLVEFFEHFLAQ